MNKYYTVIAEIEGIKETMYGSFVKKDCTYEIEAEKESWKEQGYKNIKIKVRETTDRPDAKVYAGQL